ncbi:tRNA (adenine(37)-N6)-methyltransferase [Holothuria leucospilota]|uniref:tRNA (Adenine(37)-N6)-methyltransferase n=1 Tax=Holothuria leucospilota TaxID=206669 RepID=A0A9Q1BMV6_HOLLE|nr:tRNA (adenine(37)-N6)-methyltransferase [Holothuria leucospilota]
MIFVFHKNNSGGFTKAKVKPPRLNGQKTEVFAYRSPYRPNPIGLTLAKLESVEVPHLFLSTGDTLHLSAIDIIDGTPVLDIKPFIPDYDSVLPPLASVGLEKGKDIHELNHKDEVMKQSTRNSFHVTKEMVLDENTSPLESLLSSDYLSTCELESSRNSCYPDISDLKLRECKAENTIVEMHGVKPKSDVSVGERVSSPSVNKLKVRFTPNALEELHRFKRHTHDGSKYAFYRSSL